MTAHRELVAALRTSISEQFAMAKTTKANPEDDPQDSPASSAASSEATATPATRPEPPDPFDPAALRLSSDYSEGLGVRKVISTIPVRKPNKSEWFQVRSGEQWRLQTALLEVERGTERSSHLVAPSLWPDLSGEISPALVLTCVNRAGDVFLWRVKLPGADGRSNLWTESALEIAKAAETGWVRMRSDLNNGHYTHHVPEKEFPAPKWPDMKFSDMLKIAFRGRLIDTHEHPVLRELRGGI